VVRRAALSVLSEADADTIVHEVFLRIMSRSEVRLGFQGGSMAAWIGAIAKNLAIDYHRRHRREQPEDSAPERTERFDEASEARLLIAQFRREHLPPEWNGVFEARFLEQKTQREAALSLGIHRTTLAYRELRIRALLKRFLLGRKRDR
jgi:RNA polymerase sigma-70 factor (ECF subfamily)